jgi:ATP-dependent DNA helicase RecG
VKEPRPALGYSQQEVRQFLRQDEGQYLERKSLWDRAGDPPRARDRREVRDEIAEHLAAFANAEGGLLVLGADDDGVPTGHDYPDEVVEGFFAVASLRLAPPIESRCQRIEIEGHELLLIEVERAPEAVMTNGGFPYRTGDRVVRLAQAVIDGQKKEYQIVSFEARLRPDLRDEHLEADLAKEAFARTPFHDRGFEETALRYGLGERRGERIVWRNAAWLLFGREPLTPWHPRAGVRVFRVDGTERRHGPAHNVRDWRFEGPILRLLPAVHAHLRTLIKRSARLYDLFFREMPEYPDFAWQEAIVNAVAHRDYSVTARETEVWLYDDRIEVLSPGLPPESIRIEDMNAGRSIHASRNPLLVRVLVDQGLMREEGEGIPRMFEEMQQSFLRPPEFASEQGRLRVTFRNTPIFDAGSPEYVSFVRSLPLSDRQQRILAALGREGFRSADYQDLNRVDRDTAYAEIRDLVERGIVTKTGARGRGATYKLDLTLAGEARLVVSRVGPLRRALAEHGRLSNTLYRELFGVTRRQATNELRLLCQRKALLPRGTKRGAHYLAGPMLERLERYD